VVIFRLTVAADFVFGSVEIITVRGCMLSNPRFAFAGEESGW
jgi:hypothetical protein